MGGACVEHRLARNGRPGWSSRDHIVPSTYRRRRRRSRRSNFPGAPPPMPTIKRSMNERKATFHVAPHGRRVVRAVGVRRQGTSMTTLCAPMRPSAKVSAAVGVRRRQVSWHPRGLSIARAAAVSSSAERADPANRVFIVRELCGGPAPTVALFRRPHAITAATCTPREYVAYMTPPRRRPPGFLLPKVSESVHWCCNAVTPGARRGPLMHSGPRLAYRTSHRRARYVIRADI